MRQGDSFAQRVILRRLELWLTPLLLSAPLIVGVVFILEGVFESATTGVSLFEGELLLGATMLAGTLVFEVPFLRSLRVRKRR